MPKLDRGELWWASLSGATSDAEFGAKWDKKSGALIRPRPDRPCLIVSDTSINYQSDAVTVAPLSTSPYRPTLTTTIFPKNDVNLDPANKTYIRRQLQEEKYSLIDCFQLWTIPAIHYSDMRNKTLPNDIHWDRRLGTMRDMLSINLCLQVLLRDDLSIAPTKLEQPTRGDVIEIDYPGGGRRPCLIVSSPAADALNERQRYLTLTRPFGFRTVVPLIDDNKLSEPLIEPVLVQFTTSNRVPVIMQAVCWNIHSVDYRQRNPIVIGRVIDGLDNVRTALCQYLNLPL